MLRQENEIKGIQKGKGKQNQTIFLDDTIVYVKNPKELAKKNFLD